jgi:ABC-type polysaccharide/polyol phosphate export permease
MLTKKRLAMITVLLTAVFFCLLLLLPESVVGSRAENMLIFVPKLLFLAMSAAITTAVLLLPVFKREYIRGQLASFNRYRHLLRLYVKRDFVARYRKSVLGVVWSLLHPLLTMLVMTFVFSYVFNRQISNYPVYLLSGLILFNFFNESTSQAMTSIIEGENIIKKIYVPKYIFPLSKAVSFLVNLLFSIAAFFLVILVTRAPLRWTMLLLPIPILYTFIFALGVSMLMSSLAVFFRDLTYLYRVALMLLMYLTPIIYPIEILPERFVPFIGFNPIYHFVNYFRDLALRGVIPDLWSNAVCIGFALAALCCGTYVFMSRQDKYILYL